MNYINVFYTTFTFCVKGKNRFLQMFRFVGTTSRSRPLVVSLIAEN